MSGTIKPVLIHSLHTLMYAFAQFLEVLWIHPVQLAPPCLSLFSRTDPQHKKCSLTLPLYVTVSAFFAEQRALCHVDAVELHSTRLLSWDLA